jgi:hypothetical protein
VENMIQHPNSSTLKDDKDQKSNRNNNAEIKTTTVEIEPFRKKKIKFNSESRNQSVVKKEKSTKLGSRAKLLVYRRIPLAKYLHAGPSQYFKQGLLMVWENHCLCNSFKISELVSKTKVIQKWPNT